VDNEPAGHPACGQDERSKRAREQRNPAESGVRDQRNPVETGVPKQRNPVEDGHPTSTLPA
jgi:hypothetical protein